VNVQHFILDSQLQPVPIGVPGELHIGGAGLARGYLNRPELTAEKFITVGSQPSTVNSPPLTVHGSLFTDNGSLRLYKTGDLARYRVDGNIEYLGRSDTQIKLRGLRIELGEIEAALCQHSAVREAVVIVREEANDARLVAYVVAREHLSGLGLREFLHARLPEYMIPSAFVPLDVLPLLPNGKLDRRALPAPVQLSREDEYIAPRTPTEEMLAGICAQVLNVARVGAHDNFFDLGGHSLLATQLISRIRNAFNVELPLRAMFETPTLAELARVLDRAHRAPAPPIPRAARDRVIPLSFAQQRLWFLDQLEPNNPLYNIAAAVRLEGALDADALARALNEIVQQHEALRTSFANQDGQAAQIIAPALTLDLARTDLRDAPQTDPLDLARADARLPFDLTRAPLLRARLVRIADDTHVLILVVHHIIADGWSMQILLREVIARYAARPASRIDLPIQYADYAIWQREQFKPALEEQLAYWKQKLATSSPVLDLPTDRPRPAMQTYRGALYKFELPPALGDALATLSRAEGATLFMTLLAAFQVLLSRYTGQNDFNIGAPIANRNRVEVENLIGFFVNTLVLRADLTGAPTFRELLKRTRATTLDAHAHQDAPFEWLVSALAPERDLSYSPLFQTLFDLDRAPITQIQLGDVIATPLDLDPGTAKFDLALVMAQDARGLRGSLEYNTDLFDAATIARLVKNFETLLTSIVANPELPITNYQFLAQTERDQLIAWNTTAADFPRDQCIHQLFENQVARTPDQIAVMFENETLTYRELNARANRLAHYLRKLGAQPETLIAICIERSLDTLVAMLGALKAGGAYVPLDPDYPSDRLAFMLEDSGAPIVVVQSHLAESFRNSQFAIRNLICLDSDWDTIAREDESNPPNTTTPENLAYVIYTSGSTGEPKGVLIEHRGVCNLATAYIREFAITPRSRVLQFFSFSFDGSVADIFTALLAGATLCLPSRDNALPGPAFADWLREKEITFGVFVPAALAVMEPENLPRLEVVISAGETCPPEIAEHWRNGRRFYNAYGPTEATVAACWYAVTARVASNVPIGRPFVNVQLHILDEQHQPVPIGARGELCIGGVGVARGYLNRPELTAEKFITVGSQPSTVNSPPLPVHGSLFTDNGSLRLYRTGDLARFLSDGNVEFLGRMDQQVKVRGFRIELGEIETALEQHPAIQHAAVIAREDDGIKRIVAYVVACENLEGLNLREFLRARLPEYMLPARFVPLDTLPRLPNGKVDRRALPAPIQSARARVYIAPRTRAEEILARVWAEVLRVERVSVDDNFFELGGDSILAIQVIARAHHAGLALTPKQLFQTPTIAELARVAATARASRAGQASVTGDVPLTPIQHWFFEQNLVEPHHWNQAVRVQMREPLERAAFEKTFAAILAHHDALHTRFTRDDADAGWRAHIADTHGAMPFEWIDVRAETDRALETRIAALQASLNLADGSLARAAYFDFGAARAGQLFIAIHHLAVDNVSWRILLEDLVTAYASARRGEPIALPPKTTAFQHWATRLNEHAQTDAARAEIAFWVDALNGGAPALPQDARGENSEASAQRITLEFAATAARADIADVLLTALARAGARWTNAPALRVDLEGHGRADLFDDVDVSRTVGWFTNVYPMRFAINPCEQPSEALRAIKAQLRRVPNRGIGFGLLRYLRRDTHALMAALPRAQISFNYLGRLDAILPASAPFEFVRASNGFEHSPRARRPYWIEIAAGIFGDALQVEWTYSANLHHRATIERVARDFAEQVRALLAADARDYRLSDFDVALSQAELDALVAETSAA
jgi:amino acid adenylation domain-containing protein/non-ribosomal peptide synthase protein (TIGR01720 family)